jgi:hypothetical protein
VDDFHASEYIEEASDNVDGNLKDKVTETELDASKDEQVITYSVSDSSGNTAAAELKVTLVDPVIASPAPSADCSRRDGTSTNREQADHHRQTQPYHHRTRCRAAPEQARQNITGSQTAMISTVHITHARSMAVLMGHIPVSQ